jgi:predicted RNA-binding protein with EMAP domain
MKKCFECNKIMKEMESETPEGIKYCYFRCENCGEEVVDMRQLHDIAQEYRKMKKFSVRISKWGTSLGLRIPKELTKRYNLKESDEVIIVPDDKCLRVILA